jgi:hypothetical protein
MSDKPENDLPGFTLESEKLAEIKQRLVQAESELQAYQSAQPEPFPPPNCHSTRLQAVLNDLQMAIDSLTYLDSTHRRKKTFFQQRCFQSGERRPRT